MDSPVYHAQAAWDTHAKSGSLGFALPGEFLPPEPIRNVVKFWDRGNYIVSAKGKSFWIILRCNNYTCSVDKFSKTSYHVNAPKSLDLSRGCPSAVFSSTRALICCCLFCQCFGKCQNLTGNTGILIKALGDRFDVGFQNNGKLDVFCLPRTPPWFELVAFRRDSVFICHWFFDSTYSIYLIPW